ncbi:hypothetical protein [Comamonas sp. C24C]
MSTSDAVAQYLNEQRRDMASQARYTMGSAIAAKPDYEAELRKVARSTGVPVDTVREYPEEMKQQAALQGFDFERMATEFPRTAAFLAGTENAAIAHDDTENLTAVERTLKFLGNSGRALAASLPSTSGGFAGVLQAQVESVAPLLDPLAGTLLPENPLRRVAAGLAGMRQRAEADAKALLPKTNGNIEAGYYSGLQSLGQNLLMLPAAIATGNPALATVGMALPVGGQAYGQARDKGLGFVQSATFGASQAAIEYATEKIPVGRLLGDLKAGTPFYQMLLRNMAVEIPGEQAATILQDLNEWAVINPEKPFSDYLAERPGAAVQTLVATVVGAGGQVSVVRGIDAVVNRDQNRQREAQAAEQNAQAIGELNTLAAASKVRGRDGQTFDQFIKENTADGDIQDLYISAQALAQSGLAEQVAAASPSVQQQFAQALETGGDIRIPLAEYTTTIAPEGYAQSLVEHLKTDPQGFSPAEAKQYMEQRGDQLKQEIEQTLTEQRDQQTFAAGRDEVQAEVLSQLERAKRFTTDANQNYATLAGSFYAVQAARLGITPQEMYTRYPLRIVAQQPLQNAVLDQDQRGSFDPSTNTIALLKNADLTTFLHESGHFNLETLADIASRPDAPADIRSDMDTLLKWFGVESERDADALTVWNRKSLEEKREAHEQFARGFEAYLFEGRAPNVELRSIFQRFRAWLLNVYRQISNLNVQLTPEVRGVMDRMLATADEIQAAEAANSMGMLFDTPEQAAQFGLEWKQYHDQGLQATQEAVTDLEAKGLRDMKWLTNARSRALKDLQKQASGRRKEVEAQARSQVMSQRVYQAWDALTRKMDEKSASKNSPDFPAYRLKTDDLRAAYGTAEDAVWRKLSALGMTSDARGINPDVVAEQFGYGSGDQMVQDLATVRPPQEAIAELTDSMMLERYSELATPEALDAAANEAVHNEARARFVATEQAALQKALDARGQNDGRVFSVLPKAARQFAGEVIARLRVRDVKPAQYRAAEARSARDSQTSLRSGDLPAAALAKRNQLLNFYAAKAAQDALVEVDKTIDYFRRVENSKTIDPDYKDQIDGLLEQYDLRRSTTLKEADRRKSLDKWLQDQQAQGKDPEIPEYLLANMNRVSYRDMTVEELRGLRDTIKQIEHLGRLKDELLTNKKNKEFGVVRDAVVTSIREHFKGKSPDLITPSDSRGARKLKAHQFFVAHLKVNNIAQVMDGGETGGPVWEFLARSAQERATAKTTRQAEMTEKLMDIITPVLKRNRKFRTAKFYPALGINLTREQLFSIALNMGNDGNMSRLLTGGVNGRSLSRQDLIGLVESELTADDLQAVQSIWDLMAELAPEAQAKHRRVYGVPMEMVEAVPLVTKHGTLRGGYYPVIYDPRGSVRTSRQSEETAANEALKAARTAATTRRSYTKSRLDETPYPLLLNMDGVHRGINQVLHDLTWHEWSIDIGKMLRDGKFTDAVRETYGPDYLQQIKEWHDDIVTENVKETGAGDRASLYFRSSLSASAMGYSLLTAIQQPIGLTQSAARIGSAGVLKALASFAGSPREKTAEARRLSEFMRNRGRTQFREVAELKRKIDLSGNRIAEGQRFIVEHAFDLLGWVQTGVDVPTWHAAYEKALAEGKSDTDAIAIADQAVIDTQGDGSINNLSGVQRGKITKLLTTFYSYLSSAMNMVWQTSQSERSLARRTVDIMLLTLIPATLTALVKWAPGAGDDEDKYWELVKGIIKENVALPLGMFILSRELADAVGSLATGDRPFSYQGPGAFRLFSDTVKLLGQIASSISQGELTDGLRKSAINVLGGATGLPSTQLNRTIDGAQALEEGATENPVVLGFGFSR